jgi:hypothetical protein
MWTTSEIFQKIAQSKWPIIGRKFGKSGHPAFHPKRSRDFSHVSTRTKIQATEKKVHQKSSVYTEAILVRIGAILVLI